VLVVSPDAAASRAAADAGLAAAPHRGDPAGSVSVRDALIAVSDADDPGGDATVAVDDDLAAAFTGQLDNRADLAVARAVDRTLGREGPRQTALPSGGGAMSRAGIVSRLLATAVDVVVVLLICLLLMVAVATFRLLWGGAFDVEAGSEVENRVIAGLVLVVYLGYGWGLNGRTLGQILQGLRVVRHGGGDLSFPRGFVRAALYLVFPIGLLWALFSRRNASVQDLWLGTAVVHDWGHIPTAAPG
jgi:uncharacterized RDD family membrane protein YckC